MDRCFVHELHPTGEFEHQEKPKQSMLRAGCFRGPLKLLGRCAEIIFVSG